jgi:hypothetical protein
MLSRVFRGKFVEALRRAYDRSELDLGGGCEHLRDRPAWRGFVDALFKTDWVVYAKPAFGGATAVLRYLGRYTHRVAISNHRLLSFDGDHVTFSSKDYAHGPASHDDAHRHGVSAPLRSAHPPTRLRTHSPVGIPGAHLPNGARHPRTDLARHTVAGGTRQCGGADD